MNLEKTSQMEGTVWAKQPQRVHRANVDLPAQLTHRGLSRVSGCGRKQRRRPGRFQRDEAFKMTLCLRRARARKAG